MVFFVYLIINKNKIMSCNQGSLEFNNPDPGFVTFPDNWIDPTQNNTFVFQYKIHELPPSYQSSIVFQDLRFASLPHLVNMSILSFGAAGLRTRFFYVVDDIVVHVQIPGNQFLEIDRWYSVTMSTFYHSSTSIDLKVFIDGQEVTSFTNYGVGMTLWKSASPVSYTSIGAAQTGARPFFGEVKGFAVYEGVAFDQSDVDELYNSGNPICPNDHSKTPDHNYGIEPTGSTLPDDGTPGGNPGTIYGIVDWEEFVDINFNVLLPSTGQIDYDDNATRCDGDWTYTTLLRITDLSDDWWQERMYYECSSQVGFKNNPPRPNEASSMKEGRFFWFAASYTGIDPDPLYWDIDSSIVKNKWFLLTCTQEYVNNQLKLKIYINNLLRASTTRTATTPCGDCSTVQFMFDLDPKIDKANTGFFQTLFSSSDVESLFNKGRVLKLNNHNKASYLKLYYDYNPSTNSAITTDGIIDISGNNNHGTLTAGDAGNFREEEIIIT